jgi:hypothetical protein
MKALERRTIEVENQERADDDAFARQLIDRLADEGVADPDAVFLVAL